MRPRTAAAVLCLVAVLHTWPIATAPWQSSLHHNGDAEYSAWSLAWVAHTLVRDPLNLFNANIFAPERLTLAYSEPVITPALAGAPLHWAGASPVLVYNLLLIAGLTLTGLSAWLVVWRWTGSGSAALVAGSLAAFNMHQLNRLPHLMAAHLWGPAVALYLTDRLAAGPTRRDVLLLALVVAGTAATSLYAAVMVAAAVAVVIVAHRLPRRATMASAAAVGLGLLIASPVLVPYVLLAADGMTRALETVARWSATPAAYISSTSHLHAGWSAPFFSHDQNVFFAGFTAIALALIGLSAGRLVPGSRRALIIAAVTVAGFLLSLGPATPPYRWLYEVALPLKGLRAPSRFGYLYLLGVALAAGVGVAWIEHVVRTRSRVLSRLVAALALVLVTAEAWQGPIQTTPFHGIPPIYATLRDIETPVVLVELPFPRVAVVYENGEYMVNSISHWRPIMNGSSGFTPYSYRDRVSPFNRFPDAEALLALYAEGATHVMVNAERFSSRRYDQVREWIATQQDFVLIASDEEGRYLYEVANLSAAMLDAAPEISDAVP
jgi:hypothetical protein